MNLIKPIIALTFLGMSGCPGAPKDVGIPAEAPTTEGRETEEGSPLEHTNNDNSIPSSWLEDPMPTHVASFAQERFGGEVAGYLLISTDEEDVIHAALEPSEGAARWVYTTGDGKVERFADWSSFHAKTGKFDTPEALGQLAVKVKAQLHDVSDLRNLIVDPDTYRNEYRTQGRSTNTLEYQVDERRESTYTVKDFDAISVPTLKGDTLIAFFEDGIRQPSRLEIPLNDLKELESVKFYEVRVTSDTQWGPGQSEEDVVK